jgi:hypothetical protein
MPLAARSDIVEALVKHQVVDQPDLVAERRAYVLAEQLGVGSVSEIPDCPSRLAPPGSIDVSNCPQKQLTVVAVGLSRLGGAYWEGGTDQQEEGRKRGNVSIRVIEIDLDARGSVSTVFDYVLGSVNKRWIVLKRVPLIFGH